MTFLRRHRWLRLLAVAALLVVLAIGSLGTYLAGEAGRLPWQEEPTRIPIIPFEGIPGFSAPTRAATPVPATTEQSAAVATEISAVAPAAGGQR